MSNASGGEAHPSVLGVVHDRFIFSRRIVVLAKLLGHLIPPGARVLDVGCGDGSIDALITDHRPDISVEGIDPLVRPSARIPVRSFDGVEIPYPDRSFDVVMFVDVLHHTDDPRVLLREAGRVGNAVLIKDHFLEGVFAGTTLRAMDWVGNARHGVALPYNYWPKSRWLSAFNDLDLQPVEMKTKLDLYPAPLSWLFDRKLHFIAFCAHEVPVSPR